MSNVANLESSFSFRTQKDTGYKRPTVVVAYDVPNAAGIVELLQSDDQKVVTLVTDTVQGLITSYVRSFVDADPEFDQAKLDELVAKGLINLQTIANLPKSERNTISKDDLEQFAKDYVEIMPGVTGKEKSRVELAASMFVQRYKPVAGKKDVLETLAGQLGIFVENASEEVMERNAKVVNYLADKAQELLSIDVTADAL